jgi:O-antigen/teichoic acid export membrane protein
VNRETFKILYNYSLIGFFISIAWLLIANTDNVVIGYFFDTASVAKYAIAGSIIIYLRNLVLAVAFPLRPVISHYEALGLKENISYIYSKGTKYLYYITFVIGGATVILADDFILLWLGPGYEPTAMILKILVLPAALFLPQAVANSVLYGIEEHRNILYLIIVEGILNLGLSLVLLKYYGIYGVAIGTVIPQILIYLIVLPLIVRRLLGFRLSEFYKSTFVSILAALTVSSGTAYIIGKLLSLDNWLSFFIIIAIIAAISLGVGCLIADREDMESILKGRRSRNIK